MNQKSVMRAGACVTTLFGAALLLAPNMLNAVYQAPAMNGPGIYNSMGYGACLLGLSFMNWKAAESDASGARLVVTGTLIYLVLGLVAALARQLMDPSLPATAWGNVVLLGVFAALYYRIFAAVGNPAPVTT